MMNDGAVLVFAAGAKIGALPLLHVDETMRPLPVEPIAGSLPFVEGLAVIRGRVIPVLNVAALLSGSERTTIKRFVTLRLGERSVALAVTEVLGVWQTDALSLAHVPPLLDGAVAAAVEAVGRLDTQLLLVLSQTNLVPAEVWAEFQRRGAAA